MALHGKDGRFISGKTYKTIQEVISVNGELRYKCTKCFEFKPKTGFSKTYESGNLCLACYLCNRIKSNIFTEKEMLEISKKYIVGRERGYDLL